MKQILILGAGKIGSMIAELLRHGGNYRIRVADSNANNLSKIPSHTFINTMQVDVGQTQQIDAAMKDCFAVINALPYQFTQCVAQAAVRNGCHYLDLTEDVTSTQAVKKLAETAEIALIPQCGLAPGFISIAANQLAQQFDQIDTLHLRVGALPQFPSNALKYNLTWSTEGLINEYCRPCEAIVGGTLTSVPALEELETFSLDGVNYEAFNTSGGLGTLCESFEGKVQQLNYRSVRYPGHRDIMKVLLQDLKLCQRQTVLADILETAIPATDQDIVLIFITATGQRSGRFLQESYVNKLYSQTLLGHQRSAIQLTTATSVCAVLDLLVAKKLPQRGLVKQESINFNDFINNRFGGFFDHKPLQLQRERVA